MIGSLMADRYLLRKGIYCLSDRYLLLGGRYLLLVGQVSTAWWQVSVAWQTGIYCLADTSTGVRYLQVSNHITEL